MRTIYLSAPLLLALAACGNQGAPEATDEATTEQAAEGELTDELDRVSYAIGYDIGRSFERQDLELSTGIVKQGIDDALAEGVEPKMTDDEMRKTMLEFREKQREAMAEKREKDASANLEEGKAFLAEVDEREGVKTTESGLRYEVIEEGEGATPGPDDRVTVHYKGTLVDGEEFDSSYSRGKPATFRVGGVIPGWTEALQMMQEGAKYKLYIPADLAYGERGSPPRIGPNETLVFEVELIEVAGQG